MNSLITVCLTPEELSTIKSLVKHRYKTISAGLYEVGSSDSLEADSNKLLLLLGKLDNVVIPAKKL